MIAGALRRDPAHVAAWAKELPSASSVVVYCVHRHEISQGVALALRGAGISARHLVDGIEEGWRPATYS
jgi:Fe-Mn family superoxide dismutase